MHRFTPALFVLVYSLLEFYHPTALAFNLAYFLEEEPDLEDEEEEDDP